jgi:hypothetical protein
MCYMTSSLIGGLAAVAAWALVAPPSIDTSNASGANTAAITATPVNRAAKADRLTSSRAPRSSEGAGATVENRDAATIYRDRDGRVLFQADPVSKVTVISKGFVLPQLPIRETERRAPVPNPAAGDEHKPVPIGCDPLASPISQPQLARLTGRCLVQNESGFDRGAQNG